MRPSLGKTKRSPCHQALTQRAGEHRLTSRGMGMALGQVPVSSHAPTLVPLVGAQNRYVLMMHAANRLEEPSQFCPPNFPGLPEMALQALNYTSQ